MANRPSLPNLVFKSPTLEIVAPNISNLTIYLSQKKTTFNTVHNLITFSIVFTNKNGMDKFNPPPSKIKKINLPSKLKLTMCVCTLFSKK